MGLRLLDVVAIDGPASAGKSTVAKAVSRLLNYTFLDTGAMYRAIAFGAVSAGITTDNLDRLRDYLNRVHLEIFPGTEIMRLELNGRDVTKAIRQTEVAKHASDYSMLSDVRQFCSRMQRKFGEKGQVVCEGRDMGTVVFPDARWKFFLTASVDERARRRFSELKSRGGNPKLETIRKNIQARDNQDSSRKLAPLKIAADAIRIDTTGMDCNKVIESIIQHVTSH
ncbi:(d)CMP kinase [bacterium]|nr:(d)CMP kinase [bacterium]